mgnify:CR=1 FL=1
MKKLILFLACLLFSTLSFAQLNPGDIAFVQYNADGTDDFAFVALVDIPAGEVINFTDNGWFGDNSGFRANEGVITWTAPTGGITAGTVVTIDNNPSASTGTVTESGSLNFSGSGDQIIAYQNTSDFIAALNNEGSATWQADATNSNNSALPQGLTNGTDAVAINEVDNAVYNGPTTGDKATLLAALNDNSNWGGSNDVNQTFSGTFTITAATTLAINPIDADKAEGNSGLTDFSFTVTRTGDLSGTTSVEYQVTGLGANQANATDFGGVLPTGMVNFAVGQPSALIVIDVSGDTDVENDENFTVRLINPTGGATITTETATGTIRNDDETYELRMIKYNDLDQDGTNNELNTGAGDPTSGNALTGWEFVIYDSQGNEVGRNTTSVESTGANGDLGIRASIPGLISGQEYTICETQQDGWINTEPSNGTDNPTYGEPCETVTLTSSTVVTRYFGNYQETGTGTITIVKATNPTPVDLDFEFEGTPTIGEFTLNTSGTAQESESFEVPAGVYTITEATLPANWDLTGITCDVGNFSVDLDAGSVEIDLEAGGDVTCSFTNRRWGTLTVEKEVLPDGIDIGDDAFNILLNGQPVIENGTDGSSFGPEFIDPDESQTLAEVAASSNTNLNDYCVAITCVDASNDEVAQADGAMLSDFSVDLTEEITCTVTNTLRPTADAGEDKRVCLTKSVVLADAVIGGSAMTGKWNVIAFPEGGDNAWTLDTNPTENPEAVEFSATVPGIYELQLMTDTPENCESAMDVVKVEVLNVGCGNFPWDGSKRNGNN